jgi:hypothetical protein
MVPGVLGCAPAPTAPDGPPFALAGWFVLVMPVPAGRIAGASTRGTRLSRASPG